MDKKMTSILIDEIQKVSDVKVDSITNETLIEDIGLDSFETICLINNLSERLNKDISIDDVAKLRDFSNFVNYLESK